MAVFCREEIALYLQAKVAASGFVFAYTVAHKRNQFVGKLAVCAPSHIERVERIFESECTLKLAELYTELVEVLPFDERIDNARQ